MHSYIMENISEELSVEELLKDTNFTVTEVSAKIGYPNYAYFTKLFKKYSGYTPSAYRNCFGRKNSACGQNQSNWNKSLYKKGKPDFTIKKIDNYLNKKERKTSL